MLSQDEPEEDEGLRPIPDRLLTELTAYRTLALRDALAVNPEVALLETLYSLPQAVLSLHVRVLPGDRPEKRRFWQPGARS
jgi:hypothetical protein